MDIGLSIEKKRMVLKKFQLHVILTLHVDHF